MTELETGNNEDGMTTLEFLRQRIPAAPQAYLRQLLRKGKVRREHLPVAEDTCLRAGDRLNLPGSVRLHQFLDAKSPTILHETREILVVFKPSGLAVHAGEGHERDDLTRRVRTLLKQRRDSFTAAPIHRLDVQTSGPVLFGKGRAACSQLGKLFMAGKVEKKYLALATGELSTSRTGKFCSTVPAKGKRKEAVTEYAVRRTGGGFTLLELSLKSGRMHQIRRQLADAGFPLAGDRRYGGAELPGLMRVFLHGARLAFPDPWGQTEILVECPLPQELEEILNMLGLRET
jgi:23S rRNA pseudouridine955/2504/2580 synthase